MSKAAREAVCKIGAIRRDHPLFDEQVVAIIDAAHAPFRAKVEALVTAAESLIREYPNEYNLGPWVPDLAEAIRAVKEDL